MGLAKPSAASTHSIERTETLDLSIELGPVEAQPYSACKKLENVGLRKKIGSPVGRAWTIQPSPFKTGLAQNKNTCWYFIYNI